MARTKKAVAALPKIKRYVRTTFGSLEITPYLCPVCDDGSLLFDEKLAHSLQTAKSRDDERKNESIWEPQYERRRFTCLFVCENKSCREVVSVAGEMGFQPIPGDDDDEAFGPESRPRT